MRIALVVGKRDYPGGVEDYCCELADAVSARGHTVSTFAIRWNERGWLSATLEARRSLVQFQPDWIILQFTHLMWSKRGFSLIVPILIRGITLGRASIAVVLHDPFPFGGKRLRDLVRSKVQQMIMQHMARKLSRIFVTVWPPAIPWYRMDSKRISFLPIGSNIPNLNITSREHQFTLAVFGIGRDVKEVHQLAAIAGHVAAQIGEVRVSLIGRGSKEAKGDLERLVREWPVVVEVSGLVPSSQISGLLAQADVQILVHGEVSSRRGTVLAGIVHGLPIVGYSGRETAWPMTEAGVVLVASGDHVAMAEEVVRLAFHPEERGRLRELNTLASHQYFAWDQIASELEKCLLDSPSRSESSLVNFVRGRVLGSAASLTVIALLKMRSPRQGMAVSLAPTRSARSRKSRLLRTLLRRVIRFDQPLWLRVLAGPNKGYLMRLAPSTAGPTISGHVEPEVSRALEGLVKKGGVFWDIGANNGYFTLLGARLVGTGGHVVSVEADPTVVQTLSQNVRANGFENVEIINEAAWSKRGIVTFQPALREQSPDLGLGSIVAPTGTRTTIQVEACTLDDLASRCPLPNILKCDVEGAEVEVLKGAEGLLRRERPIIVLEVHKEEDEDELYELLTQANYDVKRISTMHLLAIPKHLSLIGSAGMEEAARIGSARARRGEES